MKKALNKNKIIKISSKINKSNLQNKNNNKSLISFIQKKN